MLEKEHANEQEGGYTYVSRDGWSLPLTPLRMKEWSVAVVSRYFYI